MLELLWLLTLITIVREVYSDTTDSTVYMSTVNVIAANVTTANVTTANMTTANVTTANVTTAVFRTLTLTLSPYSHPP